MQRRVFLITTRLVLAERMHDASLGALLLLQDKRVAWGISEMVLVVVSGVLQQSDGVDLAAWLWLVWRTSSDLDFHVLNRRGSRNGGMPILCVPFMLVLQYHWIGGAIFSS